MVHHRHHHSNLSSLPSTLRYTLYDLLFTVRHPSPLIFFVFFLYRVGCNGEVIDSGYRCVNLFQKGFFPASFLVVWKRLHLDVRPFHYEMRKSRKENNKTKQTKKSEKTSKKRLPKTGGAHIQQRLRCARSCGPHAHGPLLCDPHDLHEQCLLLDIERGRRRLVNRAVLHFERYQRSLRSVACTYIHAGGGGEGRHVLASACLNLSYGLTVSSGEIKPSSSSISSSSDTSDAAPSTSWSLRSAASRRRWPCVGFKSMR